MRHSSLLEIMAAALAPLLALGACAQSVAPSPSQSPAGFQCSCGAHPPGPPAMRTVAPYAGEPDDLRPYSKFADPYYKHYLVPNIYSGAARDIPDPDPNSLSEIRIGFLGPLEKSSDAEFGRKMLQGAQLAIEQANAGGGYGGKPFRLMIHNDYDNWQAGQVYGAERPTEPSIWGSPSNEVIKMVYDEHVWAIFGSISSESTHIMLRVALRAEVPIVNSASTDPTIPETYIPWYWTDLQDDRVQSQVLARHIYGDLGLKRMAILRVNNRYGRFGVPKFRDASRRLGHPVVIEQKFRPGDTDYRHELRVIQDSHADGILLWTDQIPAANILKQMAELGMKQRVFGGYRVLGEDLLREAGPAAEGLEAVFPYDPSRTDSKWLAFNTEYAARFKEKPEQFAALSYDAMRALLDSICRAGLNRARIHDALADLESYEGVTGAMRFDPSSKNVAPMYLGTVHRGKIDYRVATVEKAQSNPPQPSGSSVPNQTSDAVPYARIDKDEVGFFGPRESRQVAEARILIFGPEADRAVRSPEVQAYLRSRSDSPLELVAVPTEGSWGKASALLVDGLLHQKAIGVIALDRPSSHLAEQLAVKCFVPVISLSDDRALTSTNIPWIFRLPATGSLLQALQSFGAAELSAGANAGAIRTALASGEMFGGVSFRKNGDMLTVTDK